MKISASFIALLVSTSLCYAQKDLLFTLEDYNLKGKVKSISWETFDPIRVDGTCSTGKKNYNEMEYSGMYTFDLGGLITKITTPFDASETQYNSYAYNASKQLILEEIENPTTNDSFRHEWIYHNDSILQEKEYYNDELQDEWNYNYLPSTRIKTKYWKDGSLRTILYDSYDENGRIIESKFENSRGTVLFHYKFEYNPDGQLVLDQSLNSDGTIGSETQFEYTDSGNLTKKTILLGDYTTVVNYDASNNVLSELSYRSDETIDERIEFEYIYDEHGNWTQRIKSRNGECELIVKAVIEYY